MEELLRLFDHVARLKQTPRAGWARCGVEPCESVAGHAFGVGILALILPAAARLAVDRDRCVALALVHDLAEAVVGDITPHDNVAPGEKHRREREAMERIARDAGDPSLLALWDEFEAGETPEAKLVRELDVIEMALQAGHYARQGRLSGVDAARFIESARSRVTSETGKTLLKTIPGH